MTFLIYFIRDDADHSGRLGLKHQEYPGMSVHDKGQIIGPNWVQSRQDTLMAMMMMTRVMMMVMIAMSQ